MVKVFREGEHFQFSTGLGKMSTENIKMNSWPSLPNKRRLVGRNQTLSALKFALDKKDGIKSNAYEKIH